MRNYLKKTTVYAIVLTSFLKTGYAISSESSEGACNGDNKNLDSAIVRSLQNLALVP